MNGECLEEGWAYFEIKNEIKIYDLVEKNSLILKYRDIIYKLLFYFFQWPALSIVKSDQ